MRLASGWWDDRFLAGGASNELLDHTGDVPELFISYRREDTQDAADRLYDSLARHFGRENVFIDIESLHPGEDFAEIINRRVRSSDVLLVLIGRRWLNAVDPEGMARLRSPGDFVRLEIEAALEHQVRIVPVLVQGASMPSAGELPPSIAPLARRQAFRITRWHDDMARLVRSIAHAADRDPGRVLTVLGIAAVAAVASMALLELVGADATRIAVAGATTAVAGVAIALMAKRYPAVQWRRTFLVVTGIAVVLPSVALIATTEPERTAGPTSAPPGPGTSTSTTIGRSTPVAPRGPDTSSPFRAIQRFPGPGQRPAGLSWGPRQRFWVSDQLAQRIFELGGDNFNMPFQTAWGLTWDGASFFTFTTTFGENIQAFRIDGGTAVSTGAFAAPDMKVGAEVTHDLTWDGENVWIADEFRVLRLDRSAKEVGGFPFCKTVTGLEWDGSGFWLAYQDFPSNALLVRVDRTGKFLGAFRSPLYEIAALAWGDGSMWALGRQTFVDMQRHVFELDLSARDQAPSRANPCP